MSPPSARWNWICQTLDICRKQMLDWQIAYWAWADSTQTSLELSAVSRRFLQTVSSISGNAAVELRSKIDSFLYDANQCTSTITDYRDLTDCVWVFDRRSDRSTFNSILSGSAPLWHQQSLACPRNNHGVANHPVFYLISNHIGTFAFSWNHRLPEVGFELFEINLFLEIGS